MRMTVNALADLTGLDRRRIKKAVSGLVPERSGRNSTYLPSEALPYIYCSEDGAYDLTQERARLAHFQADKAEHEARQISGELIEIEEVAEAVGQEYNNVRARLLAIPSKAAATVCHLSEPHEIQEVLRAAIHDALAELSYDGG